VQKKRLQFRKKTHLNIRSSAVFAKDKGGKKRKDNDIEKMMMTPHNNNEDRTKIKENYHSDDKNARIIYAVAAVLCSK